jgi:hypothetical protein
MSYFNVWGVAFGGRGGVPQTRHEENTSPQTLDPTTYEDAAGDALNPLF